MLTLEPSRQAVRWRRKVFSDIPAASHIYVFCTIDKNFDYISKSLPIPVKIQGIISRKRILEEFPQLHPSKSRKSGHYNLEIPYMELHLIDELLDIKEKKRH